MKRRIPLLIALATPIAVAAFAFVSTSRAATETPDYKVVRKDGDVEIRDYPALTIATVPMSDGEMDRSFSQLFWYITGSNEHSEKIEMTAPVIIDSEKGARTMSFIMPKQTVQSGVPKPSGKSVTLGRIEPARFAVLRFPGGRTPENEARAIEALKAWLEARKIPGKGEPLFAYYDPPWMPVPFRRNEVMIRIATNP